MHSLEQMAGKLTTCTQSFNHLIENGTLSHTIHATQDVHPAVEIPKYVLCATPQRIYLYLLNIVGIFLHRLLFSKKNHSGLKFFSFHTLIITANIIILSENLYLCTDFLY